MAVMRISAVVAGPIMYCVMAFLFAGVATLVFSFILGDEGRYRQYLAVMSHAMLIPSFIGLLLVPLRIAEQNPQLTLNLGAAQVAAPTAPTTMPAMPAANPAPQQTMSTPPAAGGAASCEHRVARTVAGSLREITW